MEFEMFTTDTRMLRVKYHLAQMKQSGREGKIDINAVVDLVLAC